MILDETYELLKSYYDIRFDKLALSDVRIGLYLTAVRLSDGSCGVASTLAENKIHCDKESRDYGEFTPSKIKGRRVIDLFETAKISNVTDTLKIAVLNAVSSRMISDSAYKIIENADPVDLIPLTEPKTITIVGGFHSYIRRFSNTNNRLYVLELNEDNLADEHKKFYIPAADYEKILPASDIIIITGFTLVNNTIDNLLAKIPSKSQVIVTGPSSSIIPDILFGYGVDIIGATRITDPDMLFAIVGEAGAGFHLFRYCALKICILNE